MAQLEAFTKVTYTNKFQQILERLQAIVRAKKDERNAALAQQIKQNTETKPPVEEPQETQPSMDNIPDYNLSSDAREIKQAIGSILYQHLILFEKAKIFEIKKIIGLQKQVANHLTGYIKKLHQSEELDLVHKGDLVQQHQDLIVVNVMRALAFFRAVKRPQMDQSKGENSAISIEHSK